MSDSYPERFWLVCMAFNDDLDQVVEDFEESIVRLVTNQNEIEDVLRVQREEIGGTYVILEVNRREVIKYPRIMEADND